MYANPRKHRALAWLLCLALLLTCMPTAFADDDVSVATEDEAKPVPPTFNGLPFIMEVPTQTPDEEEPDADAPDADNPDADVPDADDPDADVPDADDPDADVPNADDPNVDVPEIDDPVVDVPDVDEPDTDAPDTDAPDADEPDVDESDADVPDADEPDADEPDADVPDADEPDADASDADEPDADAPDADEPDADVPDADDPQNGEGDEGVMPIWADEETCDHSITDEWRSINWDNEAGYKPYDETRHVYTGSTTVIVECAKCGKTLSSEASDTLTVFEEHYFNADGVCLGCGYKKAVTTCKHDHIWTYNSGYSGATFVSSSADGHTFSYSEYEIVTVCEDCGLEISREPHENYEQVEPHRFHGGYCDVCGYANTCKHENTYTQWSFNNMTAIKPVNEKSHKFTADIYEQEYCEDCGEQVYSTIASYQAEDVWDHWFNADGVCTQCGYKKTSSSSSGSSSGKSSGSGSKAVEAVAEPELTPAPSEMVDTLLTAIDEAETSGKEMSVEVVGAKDVLSDEEYGKLKALPAREQILVTLTAVGMGDAVEAAMRAMNVTLSDEANALTTDIVARMDAASDEDYAALQATLAEKFPTKTVTIDGQEVEVFVIELEITVDGKTTTQRYGFRYDKVTAQWLFYELDA